MNATGTFFALDLGTRTGFAKGRPGECPTSGAILLKQRGEHRAVALGNLVAFICEQWENDKPALVATEAPLGLEAFRQIKSSQDNVRMHLGLHGCVEAMCARFGCRLIEANNATVRKHFIGIGRLGNRDDTKEAVVHRCHMLKLMPRDVYDEDRADAIAVHDWACATYGRKSYSTMNLALFSEGRRARR